MRSSEFPGVPEGWTDTRGDVRFYLSTVGLLSFAAISVLVGAISASAGRFNVLACSLLFALLMVLAVLYSTVGRCRRVDLASAIRTVNKDGVHGTEIRYSNWQFATLLGIMVCATAFSVSAATVFFHQTSTRTVLFGVFCLVFASFVAAVFFGAIANGSVTLSSRGITQRGRSFESHLDWSAIAGVPAVTHGHPAILVIGYANAAWTHEYTTRFWRVDRLPPVPMIELDCRQFDVDPFVLYRYVRVYADNPELRAELGTDAAVTRARQIQLTR